MKQNVWGIREARRDTWNIISSGFPWNKAEDVSRKTEEVSLFVADGECGRNSI